MMIPLHPKKCELWWSKSEMSHIFFALEDRSLGWRQKALPADSELELSFISDNWADARKQLMLYLSKKYLEWKGCEESTPISKEELEEISLTGWPRWGWTITYEAPPLQLSQNE